MKKGKMIAAVFAAFLLLSCGKEVVRVDSNTVKDLSGKWNDTDSRLVAEEMIKDCLAKPWYAEMVQNKGRKPMLIVGKIRNKSHEHISGDTFISDMERELINSGKIEFVAGKEMREELRNEKNDQSENATDNSRKQLRQETGADLMLLGTINSIIDQEDNESVRFYQINLELIDIESNKKVWIGDKKIKKMVDNNKFKL